MGARFSGNGEDGLTIVEVVVAGLILVISGVGVLGIVDTATRNTFRAEQGQIVANVLQREMEAIKQLPYEEVALTGLPATVGDPEDPRSRIESGQFAVNRDGSEPLPLVYNDSSNGGESVSEGTVVSGPEEFVVDDVRGQVFRYVVWEPCDPAWLCGDVSNSRHLKRVIVAAKLDTTASGGTRRYQEIQGQIEDPDVEPSENAGPQPGGEEDAMWTLWLTDTSCNYGSRQAIVEDHNTHNTLGRCDDLVQSGDIPGAPDLLWPEATPEIEDTIYDYALDVEPQPDQDEGLQVMVGDTCENLSSTVLSIADDPVAENLARQIHKWVTPPIPTGSSVTLNGTGAISLWTRTVASLPYEAEICVWLYVRDAAGSADEGVVNLDPSPYPFASYFSYSHDEALWPTEWGEITIPVSFEAESGSEVVIPAGASLGLAIGVSSGSDAGLQFLYDTPVFDSRIELEIAGTAPTFP